MVLEKFSILHIKFAQIQNSKQNNTFNIQIRLQNKTTIKIKILTIDGGFVKSFTAFEHVLSSLGDFYSREKPRLARTAPERHRRFRFPFSSTSWSILMQYSCLHAYRINFMSDTAVLKFHDTFASRIAATFRECPLFSNTRENNRLSLELPMNC